MRMKKTDEKKRDFYRYVREQEVRDMLTVGTENVVRGELFSSVWKVRVP